MSIVLAGCATASTPPPRDPYTVVRATDPGVLPYVHRLVGWISKVTEYPTLTYDVRLADLRARKAAGVSEGRGVIYVDVRLAEAAYKYTKENPGKMQLDLPMVLAHEIGHDLAGHAAQARNAADMKTGLLGRFLTRHYSRQMELEADRKAIRYWIALNLPCEHWVNRFQALADKGIQGDFNHPTAGRLEQAREMCEGRATPSDFPWGKPAR